MAPDDIRIEIRGADDNLAITHRERMPIALLSLR